MNHVYAINRFQFTAKPIDLATEIGELGDDVGAISLDCLFQKILIVTPGKRTFFCTQRMKFLDHAGFEICGIRKLVVELRTVLHSLVTLMSSIAS
jgi:hypothetical protein